ncbi:MAG: glutamate synthase subunit beta [Candidatus Omnitrophota bacterium]|jgi:glutamate synthase (NADPH/NADH) small chain|nr:MAG: glutamate synthase subunit beta [Candidatus Omnitrophota bacterium]
MGKVTGFLEINREIPEDQSVQERIRHYKEFHKNLPEEKLRAQGARCMDCGIPFCHWGCPLGNIIPDWNDMVYRNRWKEAIARLHKTNNFPEFTGRVCPAPCEASCVLAINTDAVTIKEIERNIIDHAFREGWIVAEPPAKRTGKKVAVVGSGPAGLAAAQQLNRAGHFVTVFEKADRVGGLLRYGIPDFKMEKHLIDRRVSLMREEGIVFKTGINAGVDITAQDLLVQFDAVVLAGGAMVPRDLSVPGRDLRGVHFALEFLSQQNKRVAGDEIPPQESITATGKRVVVIGGGDTGSDCVGTSHRHGAISVRQFEIMPKPPEDRVETNPWPDWPFILRTSTSHEEGGERDWCVNTKEFIGENGQLKKLHCVRVEMDTAENGRPYFKEIPGSDFEIEADLALLAMGFVSPVKEGLLADLGVAFNPRGVVQVDENYMTSLPGVFAAGDMSRGASLVVWAIWEGRQAAKGVDLYLMGRTDLT